MNGFEVCFGIPFEVCRAFGWNLQWGADAALEVAPAAQGIAGAPPRIKVN
jgi:hypothetical protein